MHVLMNTGQSLINSHLSAVGFVNHYKRSLKSHQIYTDDALKHADPVFLEWTLLKL